MAEIMFLPVCTKCNKIVYACIDVEADVEHYQQYVLPRYNVCPNICPNCGEHFEAIKIPTKLPFDNRRKTNVGCGAERSEE